MRTIAYRRKREGRTNYQKRLQLLTSRKPRLVVRRTNTQLIAQLVQYDPKGDKVIATVSGTHIKKLGWKHATNNLPAAYLTGYALGAKMKGKEAILDMGLHSPINGNRVYAVLKGAVDGGLKVPCDEKVFPSEDRLTGKHIPKKKDLEKDIEAIKKKVK